MNFLNFKNILITTGLILLSTLIVTIFGYFNLINPSILEIVLIVITFFIGGILTGKTSNQKGWLEGLKFSLIFIIIFLILSIIFKEFKLPFILYYFILAFSSIFGSMVGISLKKID